MTSPTAFKVMYGRNYSHAAPIEDERVVMCFGCFDLLHLGHIRHLQEAKTWGNYLLVGITADLHVNKGMGRPHFTAEQRAEALRALGCVDEVVIVDAPDPIEFIRSRRPHVYAKGRDYALCELPEWPTCESLGIEVKITKSEKWSSSRIINAETLPPETVQYLESKRWMLPSILEAFEAADKLKIAFIGEAIMDVYDYVSALGKSSKEYTLVAKIEGVPEIFEGGVLAASKHGEWRYAEVISVDQEISKTRYVDRDFNRKLFEVYSATNLGDIDRATFIKELKTVDSDVAIVYDFGHGLMDSVARMVVQDKRFLALNVQTNAGNYGFNLVTKYDLANFICVDEPEARLAMSMQYEPVGQVSKELIARVQCPKCIITRGKNGSHWRGIGVGDVPVFSSKPVDTMGAGDAVMAVTAPLIAAGLSTEAAALVGNVVGALKVGIVGHRRHVGRQEIIQTLESLLK